MSYIDYGPDPTYFIYDCGICKKEVFTSKIRTCLICSKKICRDCEEDSFCMTHFNMLSANAKEDFNQLVSACRKKKIYTSLLLAIVFITWIILFPIFLLYSIGSSHLKTSSLAG